MEALLKQAENLDPHCDLGASRTMNPPQLPDKLKGSEDLKKEIHIRATTHLLEAIHSAENELLTIMFPPFPSQFQEEKLNFFM